MEGSKSALASTGVWGGAIAAIASVLALLGIGISPDDAAQAGQHVESIVAAAYGVAGAVGGLLAIWGRIKAKKTIG